MRESVAPFRLERRRVHRRNLRPRILRRRSGRQWRLGSQLAPTGRAGPPALPVAGRPGGLAPHPLTNGETTVLLDLAAPLQARDLNPATELLVRKLAHLPWELLHDGKAFLAELGIQPVRVMQSRSNHAQPANRPLRLLFMATS